MQKVVKETVDYPVETIVMRIATKIVIVVAKQFVTMVVEKGVSNLAMLRVASVVAVIVQGLALFDKNETLSIERLTQSIE